MTMIPYEDLPTEILGLVESYLAPSDCAHLSSTSTPLHRRWSARRWQRTFQLHYGRGSRLRAKERSVKLRKCRERLTTSIDSRGKRRIGSGMMRRATGDRRNRLADEENGRDDGRIIAFADAKASAAALFAEYDECYRDGWEFTFAGCCHDEHHDSCAKCQRPVGSCGGGGQSPVDDSQRDDASSALTTQFNVTALVPSVRRLYVDLWDTIELSMLGYYDAEDEAEAQTQAANNNNLLLGHPTHHSQFPVPAIMRVLRTSLLPELAEYLYFVVGFKPLAARGADGRRRRRRRGDGGVMGPMLSRGLVGGSSQRPARGGRTDDDAGGTSVARQRPMREEIEGMRDAAAAMSAWKLACFLRQRGVGCLRCAICDRIDLIGDDFEDDECDGDRRGTVGRSPFLREFQKQVGGGDAWMTPCQCPELVHRQCLERKLGLVPKYEPWERLKLGAERANAMLRGKKSSGSDRSPAAPSESLAPRVWISYDDAARRRDGRDDENDAAAVCAVDRLGRFLSPSASCPTCGCRFLRTVRLPRTMREVLAASLSDPVSVMRAASTLVHFALACAVVAAFEGVRADAGRGSHRTLLGTPLGDFKWPITGANGFALAWWQLQQCCMLHIFFSGRFAAIVDRLWMGPISLFYCRLYFYFIVTSALLTASYIPMVSSAIRINLLEPWLSPCILASLQPVGDVIALLNLFQYAIVSTTVVCIFWRTNYRIFTVAGGKEAAASLRRREGLARNLQGEVRQREDEGGDINAAQGFAAHHPDRVAINPLPMQRIVGVGAGDGNAANHPIYHGPW